MAKGLLLAAMNFQNTAADEFNDWYDTEHIPERQRVAGFLTHQRWVGADGAPVSVAIYDLETVGVLASAAYRAIGGENLSPWSKRITAQCERLLRFEGSEATLITSALRFAKEHVLQVRDRTGTTEERFPASPAYELEILAFETELRGERSMLPDGEDSLQMVTVTQAVLRAIDERRSVAVPSVG
jgi:predicted dehydrogenase